MNEGRKAKEEKRQDNSLRSQKKVTSLALAPDGQRSRIVAIEAIGWSCYKVAQNLVAECCKQFSLKWMLLYHQLALGLTMRFCA
jgi:hypothetical protein